MRKLLILIASVAVLSFSACSNSSTGTSAATGLEGKKINTYLVGEYMSASDVQSKLEGAGFNVLASYKSVKKGTTLVFTNDALKAEGAKAGRSYAAISRVFIDEKEKMISFTNPVYFGKAFMQDEYNHTVFNGVLESINKEFSGLKGSSDKLDSIVCPWSVLLLNVATSIAVP